MARLRRSWRPTSGCTPARNAEHVVTARERIKISASRLLKRPLLDRWVSSRIVHLAGSPRLHDAYRQAALFTASPVEVVHAVLGESVDYADEYAQVRDLLVAPLVWLINTSCRR